MLPFQNTLATFQISGKDVVAALENGASQLEEGGGRFAQVAGLKYSFDKSAPVNSRIIGGRGDGGRRLEADRSRTRPIWPRPTTLSARAATATRSSPPTGRTPTTTVRASSRWLPTISPRTGPTRPSSTAASPRSPPPRRPPSPRQRRQRKRAAAQPRLPPSRPMPGRHTQRACHRRRRQFLEPCQDLLQGPDQVAGDRRRQSRQPAARAADRQDADHPAVGCELTVPAPKQSPPGICRAGSSFPAGECGQT